MKYTLPILSLTAIGQILPKCTSASYVLGTIQVAVQSNETLSLITEFNYTNEQIQNRQRAREANITVEELIASQLALEFDVCFPVNYCPVVVENILQFESVFVTDVCGSYCSQVQYNAALELIGVCEDHSYRHGNGCIDFGLTIQASSRPEAEEIKRELGSSIVSSKSVFRDLLRDLAPHFNGDVDDPDILGSDISENLPQTWYPAWNKGDELCSNDGKEPFYMKLDPNQYLAPTMTDCCRKHYWWDVRGCAAPEKTPCPEGYVPTEDDVGWNPLMSGKYYDSYPNIMYPGW